MSDQSDQQVTKMETFYSESGLQVTTLNVVCFQKIWFEPICQLLNKHGCIILNNDAYLVLVFPEGTKKHEELLRTRDCRYKIRLPDGAEFIELKPRGESISYLSFYESELPSSPEEGK